MTNYYENEYYKLKIYSKYKDKFDLNIDDDKIIIKRIDSITGWGQNLEITLRYKSLSKNVIINVGSSEENIKKVAMPIFNTNHNYMQTHYEDEKYKIYYISEEYNDVFKINYDDHLQKIYIKRLDSITGWGQELKLKFINKINNNESKIITVGKSDNNNMVYDVYDVYDVSNKSSISETSDVSNKSSISETSDVSKVYEQTISPPSYKSDNYIITIQNNKYPDLFNIFFYEENSTIYVKRTDANEGWGQLLMIDIFDIKQNYNFPIYIGPSLVNDIYKKIDLIIHKCYVSLTTIPTRIILPAFIENVKNFISHQTYPIEKMFIVIANKYKRFKENIPNNIINTLKQIPKVVIITLDEDMGPASKYLGPLMNYYDILKNNLLIIIDDDRVYNKNLIKHFTIGFNSNPVPRFASGQWSEYFNKDYSKMDDSSLALSLYKEKNDNNFFHGQGVGGFFGFCLKVNDMHDFINYNIKILNRLPSSIYHDEGIILGYLKYNKEVIMYLKHKGCTVSNEEMVDALCTSNLVNRQKIEKEILQITNLERLG